MQEDYVYNDERGVRITSEYFYADGKAYDLLNIREININRKPTGTFLDIFLTGIGILSVVAGSTGFGVLLGQVGWNLDMWLIGFGVFIIVAAILRLIFISDEYRVKITTTDGSIDTASSGKLAYVTRLAASLKRAYYRKRAKRKKNSQSN